MTKINSLKLCVLSLETGTHKKCKLNFYENGLTIFVLAKFINDSPKSGFAEKGQDGKFGEPRNGEIVLMSFAKKMGKMLYSCLGPVVFLFIHHLSLGSINELQRYPSRVWSQGIYPSLPGSRLRVFIAMQVQHFYTSSTNG